MKKLSNKGFAISAVIYGLSIMGMIIIFILMRVMSSNRANTKEIIKTIEAELNRFSKTETTLLATNPPIAQEYIVPEGQGGYYRIECWGSKGSQGLGAYTSGIIHLEENQKLYFYVGKNGKATDVRVESGEYNNFPSYQTRIMVASGGGSANYSNGGTLYGYNSNMIYFNNIIKNEEENKYELENGKNLLGFISPYNLSNVTISPTSVDALKPFGGTNGGGDGYISSSSNIVGGSSFISGYAGSNAAVKAKYSAGSVYTYYDYTYDDINNTMKYGTSGKVYKFLDGRMYPGVNHGEGRVKIEKITNNLNKLNSALNNIRYVKDCYDENTNTNQDYLIAVSNNQTIRKEFSNLDGTCKTIDLGSIINIDDLAIFHKAGVDYKNHIISVSSDGNNWRYLKNSNEEVSLSQTETVVGSRISAYQPDYTSKLANGNYYIYSVLLENKILGGNALFEYINDDRKYKWTLENIEGNIYKLINNYSLKALGINGGNFLIDEYQNLDTQKWEITPLGNRTYTIKNVGLDKFIFSLGDNLSIEDASLDIKRFKFVYIH